MSVSSSRMRLLFIFNNFYFPQFVGGAQTSTHDLCVALRARGHDVAVLCALSQRGILGLMNRVSRRLRPRYQFPRDTIMGYPVFRGWEPVRGISEVLARFDPSVVVLQGGRKLAVGKECLRVGIPTAVYYRDVASIDGEYAIIDPRFLSLANSQFIANSLRAEQVADPIVVPPLVDPERVRVRPRRERVVFVNLNPTKGVEIAFELARHRPDIPFDFVESWRVPFDDFSQYQRRAAALGNVRVLHSRRDPRELYQNAKVVLVPSQVEEGWGRVATEAQVSGIPVLASRRGALPESVGPGGILVEPSARLDAWLAGMSRLWDDDAEYNRLSAAAFKHAQRPDIQPDRLLDHFLEALRSFAAKPSRAAVLRDATFAEAST